ADSRIPPVPSSGEPRPDLPPTAGFLPPRVPLCAFGHASAGSLPLPNRRPPAPSPREQGSSRESPSSQRDGEGTPDGAGEISLSRGRWRSTTTLEGEILLSADNEEVTALPAPERACSRRAKVDAPASPEGEILLSARKGGGHLTHRRGRHAALGEDGGRAL